MKRKLILETLEERVLFSAGTTDYPKIDLFESQSELRGRKLLELGKCARRVTSSLGKGWRRCNAAGDQLVQLMLELAQYLFISESPEGFAGAF